MSVDIGDDTSMWNDTCGGRTEEVSVELVIQAVLDGSVVKVVKKRVQERAKLISAHSFKLLQLTEMNLVPKDPLPYSSLRRHRPIQALSTSSSQHTNSLFRLYVILNHASHSLHC